ncbi:hypothetical protein HNR06_004553 [Nocardiopsis arvandica]|uniref:Uncharacterized protein n=1 Tax=Nocardiopsis sinuspersici TaxID=501010 RepID=A0A7Z0BMZ5_9ACTN|nr:hypothetical protein [Nocardiopsis sinuspersici]
MAPTPRIEARTTRPQSHHEFQRSYVGLHRPFRNVLSGIDPAKPQIDLLRTVAV